MRSRSTHLLASLAAGAALATWLAGCVRQPDLTPRPERLDPPGAHLGEARSVRVLGSGFFPRAVQSAAGGPAAIDASVEAYFDGLPALALEGLAWRSTGVLEGRLPPGLALGTHSLTVVNAHGLAGTLDAALVITRPASLTVTASLDRRQASVDQEGVTLSVTARNDAPDGSAALLGVVVTASASVAGATVDLLPSAPFDLPPQASHQVDFAVPTSAAGPVRLTAAASGTEEGTRLVLDASAAELDLLVQTRPELGARLVIPGNVAPGPFEVTMTVANDGEAAAQAVVPGLPEPTPDQTGATSLVSGPTPTSADVPGGGAAIFRWTFTFAGPGTVELLAGAAGHDANDGRLVVAPATESNLSRPFPEVTPVADDPLGDGTPAAALATRGGLLWVGPGTDGRTFWRLDPASGDRAVVPVAVAVDRGASPAENGAWRDAAGPADTFGSPTCTVGRPECGPANEDGRGVLAAGAFAGEAWLVYAGASRLRSRFLYVSSADAAPLAFAAVDLGEVLATTALAPSAVAFAPAGPGGADRLYAALVDQDARKSPRLVALAAVPEGTSSAWLDARPPRDALDLDVTTAPGVGGNAPVFRNPDPAPRVEALAWFRDRLYVASGHGILRAAVAVPGPYATAPADWVLATPSTLVAGATWALVAPVPASGVEALTPADRAVPAMAAFGDCQGGPCLLLARNVRPQAGGTAAQLWRCDPARSGAEGACDGGDWSLVAQRPGAPGLSKLGHPANGAISLLLSTGGHLFVGFDNPEVGVQVFRAQVGPGATPDFRGQDGCLATDPACPGLGGDGLGRGPAVTRIFDAESIGGGDQATIFVAAGDGATALRLFSLPE